MGAQEGLLAMPRATLLSAMPLANPTKASLLACFVTIHHVCDSCDPWHCPKHVLGLHSQVMGWEGLTLPRGTELQPADMSLARAAGC